jgi:hypothetical protein
VEDSPPCAHPRGKPDPLQHRGGRDKSTLGAQMCEHRLYDPFATVSRPGSIRAHLQAGTPVRQSEAAQVQALLQLDQVFPARLSPVRVIAEQLWVDAQLAGDKGQHGRRQGLRGVERAT